MAGLLAFLLAGGAWSGAEAGYDQERVTFEGGLRVVTASRVCIEQDVIEVGATLLFSFLRDVRSDRNRDVLRMTRDRQDHTFSALKPDGSQGLFGRSGALKAVYVFSRGNTNVQDGSYANFVFTPTAIGVNTLTLRLKGQLRDFDVAGCTIGFEAVGIRRAD